MEEQRPKNKKIEGQALIHIEIYYKAIVINRVVLAWVWTFWSTQ